MAPRIVELPENIEQKIEVSVEIGHKAAVRSLPTKEGCTHDWIVYVRTDQDQFVEKVEFNLHPSFKKPRRVVRSAPFQVVECGYGGFRMSIVVHFRVNNQRQPVPFDYYLFLGDAVVSNNVLQKVSILSGTLENSKPPAKKKPGRPRKNNKLLSTNTSSELSPSTELSSSSSSVLSSSSSSVSSSNVSESINSSTALPVRKAGRPRKNGTIPVKSIESSSSSSSPPTSKLSSHDNRDLRNRRTVSTLPADKLRDHVDWSLRQTATINQNNVSEDELNEKIRELLKLQETLMTMNEKNVLKRVVGIIQEAGYLKVTESSFDFDLMEMDGVTIECIKRCIEIH
ncbi:hypothetical protein HELRODRAFT_176543 [Helobdella robusta]|uniref:YEATS domain-containing protein n=1 Tax=Helobdella robusta TaxID=6412 RepID=T1FAM2_HELRO|nr:hypothetical protein HELRODRAFT_176525 [Helobdella robusta]XP_009022135.1 hypothetical protein HELRODRAFT_176543 [Helobdella robusta]ESN99763.1 hypothetical protein HELRODRAFT_176525 [Helobdella robusta]ESN99778.1 hypothetical protein HELRODRAFT_176543 [Helobdella robusta]